MSISVIISVVCNLLTIVVQGGVNFRSSCFYLLASLLLSACLCAFVCLSLYCRLFVSFVRFSGGVGVPPAVRSVMKRCFCPIMRY